MSPERWYVSDVDGTLCIAWESTDYCEPTIVTNHWPTKISTREALRFFDVADLSTLECRQTMPGEYYVGTRQDATPTLWRQGQHLQLTEGARTQSIRTDKREAPRPKTRCECYWSDGQWIVRKAKKNERVNPLELTTNAK
jgi:hypothetical protein